ncbi:MAG TPA: hypothetical protein VHG08_26770 [Longimicrobium sp.]|nr:hypothetical protein [Longimicrobium sp.]
MGSLLAVDLGLRTGLALYGGDGRLRWYRSQNFGTAARLRRAVHGTLRELPEVRWLVIEGGGNLAEIWTREAERIGIGSPPATGPAPAARRSGAFAGYSLFPIPYSL